MKERKRKGRRQEKGAGGPDESTGRGDADNRETETSPEEKSRRKKSDFYRLLVENTLDLITLLDAEGKIIYGTPSVSDILGYGPRELKGTNAFELVHPHDLPYVMESFERCISRPGVMEYVEFRFRHKDGSWRFFGSLGNNQLHNPEVRGILVNSRDITDLKQAEMKLRESEEMYRALVQASPDAVTMTDLEGKITYVSRQTLELHGYTSEQELLGNSAFDLIAPEDHGKAAKNLRKTLSDGVVRNVDLTLVRKDGSRFIAELNAALIRDAQGKPSRFVAFTRDISERKRMEKELRDRNEELEAFAYTISHDLLTPAAIMEGYAKAALEADAEGRPDAERECLESIMRGARRMSDLIDSLLQYAQAGRLEAELEPVNPHHVLREMLIDLQERIEARGAEIIVGEDLPAISVDAMKLHQVFFNLVDNALKHTGDVERPVIEVGAREGEGTVVFYVRDNGEGIPSDLHKKIFEPFKHFSTYETPGLGIGLATVKRAVEAWGGRIWVESRPGEGATFFFTVDILD